MGGERGGVEMLESFGPRCGTCSTEATNTGRRRSCALRVTCRSEIGDFVTPRKQLRRTKLSRLCDMDFKHSGSRLNESLIKKM